MRLIARFRKFASFSNPFLRFAFLLTTFVFSCSLVFADEGDILPEFEPQPPASEFLPAQDTGGEIPVVSTQTAELESVPEEPPPEDLLPALEQPVEQPLPPEEPVPVPQAEQQTDQFVASESERPVVPVRTVSPAEPLLTHNLYVEEFFMNPDLRLQYQTTDVEGFVFLSAPNRKWNTNYSVVTDFKGNILKTQLVGGLNSIQDAEKWIRETLETADFEGVPIRRLTLPPSQEGAEGTKLFWVGHRAFESGDAARSEIALVKSIAESQGLNFNEMVEQAGRFISIPEKPVPVEIKSLAQYEKEEALALKWMDAMDFGEDLFGPFQGDAAGEPILWQSFGETTWRNTNLESRHFNNQVGFWTNRLVFKGIRAPINTINPYVEETTSIEAVGVDFKSNLKFFAGLEWRPFERSAWLHNFRPWSLPLLLWMRSYRLFVQYGNRKNLKDEILNSDNHELKWGFSIFYEWGIDLPAIAEGRPNNVPDFLRKYTWGEYFGDYRVEMTNFGSEDDYDSWIWDTSVLLGVYLPGIPLPPNPINDELVLMPYMKFSHVNNIRFATPASNQGYVGVGIRWMPFRSYRFKESEWLSKVKIFGEYIGIGRVQHYRQHDEAPYAVRDDFRVGINFSSRRF